MHYHIMAGLGAKAIVGHTHRVAPKGHEHEGMRGHARTLKAAYVLQEKRKRRLGVWRGRLGPVYIWGGAFTPSFSA
jgi:hypothetical protein